MEVKGMAFSTPEVHDLYANQPARQLRRIELLRLCARAGIPTQIPLENGRIVDGKPEMRTLTKDELVPRVEMAISDGKIRLGAPPRAPANGSGVHLPDPSIAEAAFRGELEQANAFQLRAMLPRDHALVKNPAAKKAELIEAIVAVVKAA